MSLRTVYSVIGFVLLFIFIALDTPPAFAESGQTYQVGTSNLNVRTVPSSDGQVIGQLNDGDQVIVFKESNGWAQTYYDGKKAWIALHYLYQDHGGEPKSLVEATSENVTITENSVRVRSGPGTAYSMTDSTSAGESFQLLDSKNSWHKVALHNGSTGWVAGWLTNSSSSSPTKTSHSNTNTSQSLSGYNIVLDPGHGGKDPGSIAFDGSYEKDIILSTAHTVADRLRTAGATVIMTRTNDSSLSLQERVSISNSHDTDAFISLHYDAYPIHSVNGFSTHYYSPFGNDRRLAQTIQSGIAGQVDLNDRGVMQNNYYVLRENSDLAVLVELGFITNPYDLSFAQTADYQSNVAEGITNGLINYFQ